MTAGETHAPAAHEYPDGQACAHAPQFFESACVLTHRPLQSVWLGVHGVCATQAPDVQTSALPQLVPSVAAGFEHAPLDGLQTPATWQVSRAAQVTGLLPVHAPPWHASLRVQALPSLQVVPSAAAGFEQAPLVGSHVPATWHASEAVQVTGLDPVHVPAEHA